MWSRFWSVDACVFQDFTKLLQLHLPRLLARKVWCLYAPALAEAERRLREQRREQWRPTVGAVGGEGNVFLRSVKWGEAGCHAVVL